MNRWEDIKTCSSKRIFKSCIPCSPGARSWVARGGGGEGVPTGRGPGLHGTTLCCYCCAVSSLPVSKKLAPIPPKAPFGQPGAVPEQSAGQPCPLSLSPTPPSTPSPYGLSCPPGYPLAAGQLSPAAAAPPLASPPSFMSTLTKSRPTPKPRQRPTLPPPQPPTGSLSASSPQSTEHPVLDGMSPGESMSTGEQASASPGFPTT